MRMPAKAGPNTVSRYEKPGSEKNVNPLVSPKAPLRSLVKGRCRVVGQVALSLAEGNLGAGGRRASHEILHRPLLRMTARGGLRKQVVLQDGDGTRVILSADHSIV